MLVPDQDLDQQEGKGGRVAHRSALLLRLALSCHADVHVSRHIRKVISSLANYIDALITTHVYLKGTYQ